MPAAIRLGALDYHLLPRQGWRSLALAIALGVGFGAYMAIADRTVFAAAIPEAQRATLAANGLAARLAFYARGAVIDEIAYRLIAMTALTWGLAWLSGRAGRTVHWAAIALTALVIYPLGNWPYFLALDPSGLTLARELALHGAAGLLWGWLYWRHGWLSGLAGHVGAHLALQPLLTLA